MACENMTEIGQYGLRMGPMLIGMCDQVGLVSNSRGDTEMSTCSIEGAFAGLVDDRLAVQGSELRDDLPAWLAAGQHASERARLADGRACVRGATASTVRGLRRTGLVHVPGVPR